MMNMQSNLNRNSRAQQLAAASIIYEVFITRTGDTRDVMMIQYDIHIIYTECEALSHMEILLLYYTYSSMLLRAHNKQQTCWKQPQQH